MLLSGTVAWCLLCSFRAEADHPWADPAEVLSAGVGRASHQSPQVRICARGQRRGFLAVRTTNLQNSYSGTISFWKQALCAGGVSSKQIATPQQDGDGVRGSQPCLRSAVPRAGISPLLPDLNLLIHLSFLHPPSLSSMASVYVLHVNICVRRCQVGGLSMLPALCTKCWARALWEENLTELDCPG